jgi:hypothetical protein
MKVTKGEYSQFSLKGRIQLLKEFGKLIVEKKVEGRGLRVFELYDFYVVVLYKKGFKTAESAELISPGELLRFYMNKP